MLAPDDGESGVGFLAVVEVEPSAHLVIALLATGVERLIDVDIFSNERREIGCVFWRYTTTTIAVETVDVDSCIDRLSWRCETVLGCTREILLSVATLHLNGIVVVCR